MGIARQSAVGSTVSLADLERDPDTVLATLRVQEPVSWVPEMEMWLVTRWDDVATIEAHPEIFTAATEPSLLARTLGPNMLTCDAPEHTRLAGLMSPPFQAGAEAGHFARDKLVALADSFLDPLAALENFDVMEAYAQPLSAASLAAVLGLDGGAERIWSWCEGLCTDLANMTNDPKLAKIGAQAKAELGEAIREQIARAERGDVSAGGAIASFVAAGASTEDIINNVRLMISGGINEPRDGIGLVAWVMLTNPYLKEIALGSARGMRRLIEEVFRRYSPVGTITRQATQDTELGGVAIPKGDLVSGVLRSVNLDESHWRDPLSIDLERKEGPHAAFALGAHRCLGEWLGRQEVKVGVERLFARFPDLTLEPGCDVTLVGFEFRGPTQLRVCI